jgi:hypothetical protein
LRPGGELAMFLGTIFADRTGHAADHGAVAVTARPDSGEVRLEA